MTTVILPRNSSGAESSHMLLAIGSSEDRMEYFSRPLRPGESLYINTRKRKRKKQ